jgi:hypothetical protein
MYRLRPPQTMRPYNLGGDPWKLPKLYLFYWLMWRDIATDRGLAPVGNGEPGIGARAPVLAIYAVARDGVGVKVTTKANCACNGAARKPKLIPSVDKTITQTFVMTLGGRSRIFICFLQDLRMDRPDDCRAGFTEFQPT